MPFTKLTFGGAERFVRLDQNAQAIVGNLLTRKVRQMPSIELPAEPTLSADTDREIDGPLTEFFDANGTPNGPAAPTSTGFKPTGEAARGGDSKPARRAWYWRWIDNRVALLAILFLVTGAFGLPLLYHSRAFSTRMKWAIAIANVVYTVVSCYWAYLEIAKSVAIIQAVLA